MVNEAIRIGLEKNRVNQRLHKASKEIVLKAKEKGYGIVMEKIKRIRKLYRRGSGQGGDYRAKMNSWSFYELQRQIEYKAKWEGVKAIYVDARGTSRYCSTCGLKLYSNGQRQLWCPKCEDTVDRDVNAAKNILARGVRFRLDASPREAMIQEPHSGNPESRWLEVNSGDRKASPPTYLPKS